MIVSSKVAKELMCPYLAGLNDDCDKCKGNGCMAFVESVDGKGFCGMMNRPTPTNVIRVEYSEV